MKFLYIIFVVIFISGSFAFSQEEQKDESSYPKFIPYVQEVNNLQANNVNMDIKQYGKEQPARWLSVDPMANKYPGWSPYNYTLSNPLRFIDPKGMAPSTYTDEDGNVQKITNDGKRDLYRQKDDGTYQLAGQTVDLLSFADQDNPYNSKGSINIGRGAKVEFGSNAAGDAINNSLNEISSNLTGFANYAINALPHQRYDIKYELGVYSGSQISPGLYASGRDAGNILAGAAANKTGLDFTTAMTGFGSLQMGDNKPLLSLPIFLAFMTKPLGSASVPNYGEDAVSHRMQVYGYGIYGK
jgi:RHS repeat-associated protein